MQMIHQEIKKLEMYKVMCKESEVLELELHFITY